MPRENKMTIHQAISVLKEMDKWRTGQAPYNVYEPPQPYSPHTVAEATQLAFDVALVMWLGKHNR